MRIPCSWTSPWPSNPSAPLWVLASSSLPRPLILLGPLGSLTLPAPPSSVCDHPPLWHSTPLALSRPSIPLDPSGSSFPPVPPWSLVVQAPPQSSESPPLPQSHELVTLLWLFNSLSPPQAITLLVLSPSVCLLVSSALGYHPCFASSPVQRASFIITDAAIGASL